MAINWTDTLAAGAPIKKVHVNELDSNYTSIEQAVTFPSGQPATFTAIGPVPRKVYLNELRSAVTAMETKFSNNCNCLTNPNCCQACQTCQGCQTVTCQSASCQSCQANCNCDCNCDCNCSESH